APAPVGQLVDVEPQRATVGRQRTLREVVRRRDVVAPDLVELLGRERLRGDEPRAAVEAVGEEAEMPACFLTLGPQSLEVIRLDRGGRGEIEPVAGLCRRE